MAVAARKILSQPQWCASYFRKRVTQAAIPISQRTIRSGSRAQPIHLSESVNPDRDITHPYTTSANVSSIRLK